MTRFIFLLALLLSSASIVKGQQVYGNYYHDLDSGANSGIAVRRLPDSNLFIFGGGNYLSGGRSRLGGVVLSPNGSSIVEYHLQNNYPVKYYHNDFGNLIPLSNGDLITHQCLGVPSTPDKYYATLNASLVRFKPNGDTAWVKTYTDTNLYSQAPSHLFRSNTTGSFLMCGVHRLATTNITSGYLSILDSAANQKRFLTYRHPQYTSVSNYIQRAAFLPNGTQVLATCAARTHHLTFNGIDYFKHHPWVFICDTQGTILKQRIMPKQYSGGNTTPSSSIDQNGGYYLVGALDSVLDPMGQFNLASPLNDPPFLMHLDTALNTQWVISFGDSMHSYHIYTVKQLRNNKFLLIGATNLPDTPGLAGWLAVVNQIGTLKWSRRYHKSINWGHQLFDAIENADGSITAVGYGKRDGSPPETQTDIWVLQVDSNGCEGPAICGPSLAVAQPPTPAVSTFKAYPNPTAGTLTLESAGGGEATLYSLMGARIWQQTFPAGKETVQVPKTLAAGIYLLRFQEKSGAVSQTRLVYQP